MFRIPPISVAALALFAAAAFARAAPLVLNTPTNVTQCATTFVSWSGGIRVSLILHPVHPSPTVPRLTPPQRPTSSCAPAPLHSDTPDPHTNFFNSLNTSAPAGGTIGVGIQNTSIAWTVAEPAGQDLFLLLTDSGTSTAESSRIVVGPSNDASCLG
ncbi:hypothetical protein K488DRAFT_85363 [Vararia minispora EC-137]|uniref:Uncharacterized protein n=1 Tax=Vararia minispora EC-137 TaxID=1314806 RepID=A0ACB8QMV5_9AGAM|nr:hypothetical protein K488DRAFT_85363 [Vararia minispora EC-137]